MTRIALVVPLLVVAAGPPTARPRVPGFQTWSFEGDKVGNPPAGFTFARTGSGRPGRWVVRGDPRAPSGEHVLAQTDTDPSANRFPVAVVDGLSLADVRVVVQCKLVSGRVDQACGLVFRYVDPNNYYVAHASALHKNVRVDHLVGGKPQELGTGSAPVVAGSWHELRVEAQGENVVVLWDGKRVIAAYDPTPGPPGKVGVWTKADSVTLFDDLGAEARSSNLFTSLAPVLP